MSNTAPLTTRSNGSADSNPLQMAAARGKWRQWEDPIKVCSVGKSDRRRDVTQGNPLRLSEWGFKIRYFPIIYGDFCTFSCFSLDTEDQIFQRSTSYRCAMYTYGATRR